MKKLLSILLTLALALALLVPAFAEKAPAAGGGLWTPQVIAQAEDDGYKEAPGWMTTIAIVSAVLGSVLVYALLPLVLFIPIANLVLLAAFPVTLGFPLLIMMFIELFWNIFGYTVFPSIRAMFTTT